MNKVEKYIEATWDSNYRFKTEDTEGPTGFIGLPRPYTVAGVGAMFNEIYYWGTFFTNFGLLLSGREESAKDNVDNMIYMVNRFGYVPNANRHMFETRSQPPFLSMMVLEVYKALPNKEWLKTAYDALTKEYKFWQENRITESGLNRYLGADPKHEKCAREYCGRIHREIPTSEEEILEYSLSFQSGAESGWDFSSRAGVYNHHFNFVCLNSMLYGLETNMAYFSKELGLGEENIWEERAEKRATLMNELMWDEEIGAFCDYDFVNKKKGDLVSLAMFYPLFVGLATAEQAEKTMKLLPRLEGRYAVAACEKRDDLMNLQWDFPHGWPPLQLLLMKGFMRYGYTEDAIRLAKKYIEVADMNFEATGQLWEKYNSIDGSVSATKEYKTPPMMGWSAGIYLYSKKLVKENDK